MEYLNPTALLIFCISLRVIFFVLRLFYIVYGFHHERWSIHLKLITIQVTDYLLKRGFTQTEEVFRKESSNLGPDGKPIHQKVEEMGPKKYIEAFSLLNDWIENNLDLYKVCVSHPAKLTS